MYLSLFHLKIYKIIKLKLLVKMKLEYSIIHYRNKKIYRHVI